MAAGIPFEILPAEVDETPRADEDPVRYVQRLAREKAAAIGARAAGRPVLAADTVVVAGGEMLGKPRDAADARRMLLLLSGTQHLVITGVCLSVPAIVPQGEGTNHVRRTPDTTRDRMAGTARDVRLKPDTGHAVGLEATPAAGTEASRTIHLDADATTVVLAPLSAEELNWYVRTGEPMGKAGAYAIQGLASRFVTRIEGSYSNVVGLPVSLVYGMCRRAGLLLS